MSKVKTNEVAEVEVDEVEEAPAPAATVTPAELALAFGTDAKTMRRFLRNVTQAKAGKGGRWAIDAALVPELKDRWESRNAATATVTELPADSDADEEIVELDDIDG